MHSLVEFTNYFHFTNSVWKKLWEEKVPTQKAGNILSCGMSDAVPSGLEVRALCVMAIRKITRVEKKIQ